MPHFRSYAVIVAIGVAVFAAPSAARAVTLSELFAGATISAGNLTFSDWTLKDVVIVGGGFASPDRIEVYPVTDDPLNPGLSYSLFLALETSTGSPIAPNVELTYSFRVTSSGPPIENTTVRITAFSSAAREGSRVRVIQSVEKTGGAYLSQIVAFARSTDTLETPNLVAFEALASPRTSTIVETAIAAGGTTANDYIGLRGYEQRFGWIVPEPGALTLCIALFSSTAGLRIRRRRQSK